MEVDERLWNVAGGEGTYKMICGSCRGDVRQMRTPEGDVGHRRRAEQLKVVDVGAVDAVVLRILVLLLNRRAGR